MPHLTIIVGPNGSGKSTLSAGLAEAGGPLDEIPVIDPDRIAREKRPGAPETASFEAGREALRRQRGYLEAGRSFAVETTLSGSRGLRLLREAEARGYQTRLIYVAVEGAEKSRRRVEQRVREGGHDVPAEDVRRRYRRSLANLPEAMAAARRVVVYDNTGREARAIFKARGEEVIAIASELPAWFAGPFERDARRRREERARDARRKERGEDRGGLEL